METCARLAGRVGFITGAGSGIGRAIALRYGREGAIVVCTDLNPATAEATATEIEKAGGQAVSLGLDVGRPEMVERTIAKAREVCGRIDILVNNAGIRERAPFWELSEEDWDRTFNINVRGYVLCARAVARQWVPARHPGRIINISSIHAEVAVANQAHYCASKGAIRMFTKAIAVELAPYGVRVNAIGPGVIETALTRDKLEDPDTRAWLLQRVPLHAIGQPADIAAVAAFLASDDAEYFTGATLYVDGGWLSM